MPNFERFSNKIILAPMVRAGQLPLRLLALNYGADLVYTEEIIDYKLLQCTRRISSLSGTIDYCISGGDPILRICPKLEGDRIVLQMGTNDAERALKVAKMLENDVGSIDINMGCPKPFSVKGGMGVALLSQLDRAKMILTTLVDGCSIPITCKMRVLDKPEDTVHFAREIEKCGISALALHGRRRDERPQHANRNEELREVARAVGIPVIASGGSSQIVVYSDIGKFRESTGCCSVMLARKALNTPSIFLENGPLFMDEDISKFLDYTIDFDSSFSNTKYVLQRILGSHQEFDVRGRLTVKSSTLFDIYSAWNKLDRVETGKFGSKRSALKRKLENVAGIETIDLSFSAKKLIRNKRSSPKEALFLYCREGNLQKPAYNYLQKEKQFNAIVTVNNRRFSSGILQPNKKMAEQVAALVALHGLDIRNLLLGDWEDS